MSDAGPADRPTALSRLIRFCLANRLVVGVLLTVVIGWGLAVAPFDWDLGPLLRDPVPVDAIPDIGANQQIVYTEWPGQSPREVDDQISYPLSAALLNVSGVETVRSTSMFGFSSIYIIFDESVTFRSARARVLEKLAGLQAGRDYPEGVRPTLGPEATALGQIFWYTLEGRDPDGRPTGGWDLEELRTAQDWIVRYHLMAAAGVGEVASVGGFVREYHVDVDPDAMRAYGVTLQQVHEAVRRSNLDVGAKTIELNQVEYFVRGMGYIRDVADIETAVVAVRDDTPILVRNVATVGLGPALRRGALDKNGVEAVGGVVVAAFGENPLAVIKTVQATIDRIAPGLPSKTLPDGTVSRITIVPFYDRTGLIHETLGTLESALWDQVLITVIVVVVMVMHLRSSALISSLLPIAVLMAFIAMKNFAVDANIVALSGIAIAIGTMVDMGIVICENILRHIDEAPPDEPRLEVIHRAAAEVGPAVLTAVLTTVVGFMPVLTMAGEQGKLFSPLAYAKIFALTGAIIVALTVIPPAALVLFTGRAGPRRLSGTARAALFGAAALAGLMLNPWLGAGLGLLAAYHLLKDRLPAQVTRRGRLAANGLVVIGVGILLTRHWEPLGPQPGMIGNMVFVAALLGVVLGLLGLFRWAYPAILRWCLRHKLAFLAMPTVLLVLGAMVWQGFDTVAHPVTKAATTIGVRPDRLHNTRFWAGATGAFPGLQTEMMPPLDEGSFLWMPSISPHGSIGAALDVLSRQGAAFRAIPEVESAVGKIGRAESALDPAPLSMIETVINYHSEYKTDAAGRRLTFKVDPATGDFIRDDRGDLIEDPKGLPYRQWRDQIRSPDDIWHEITTAGRLVGVSPASKLQPIETRRIMLQTGMRSRMGLKIFGLSLQDIEEVGVHLEQVLREVPSIRPESVTAERQVAKPYLVIDTTAPEARTAMSRFGVNPADVLDVVEMAVGGKRVTTTVEGPQRFAVRVRYPRELRSDMEGLRRVLVPGRMGGQIPLGELVDIRYEPGPQSIRREAGSMVGYLIFEPQPGRGEVDVVNEARRFIGERIAVGDLQLPPGTYLQFNVGGMTAEAYARQQSMLYVVLAVSLLLIFLLLYLRFRSVSTTVLVFVGIFVAWAGGFVLLGLYGTDWFGDFTVFGMNIRDVFNVHPIKMSVAVWVGFLALFGIASDDGVLMATYLDQSFAAAKPSGTKAIREATVAAGRRRVRPCLMTTATTILALVPVLTSTGRGSDVMVPMAIPIVGGMTIAVLTMLVVPVLYCWIRERRERALSGLAADDEAAHPSA